MFFFFFFQAEDGIRDADVTGVQTCALPIYKGAGVVPGLDDCWGDVQRLVQPTGELAAAVERRDLLGVALLDHAEAAELAFQAVVEAVVVAVGGDELGPADSVLDGEAAHARARGGQRHRPGRWPPRARAWAAW